MLIQIMARCGQSASVLLLLMLSFSAFADPMPPPEAFGALPSQTDLESSPDGHWLAWLDNQEDKPRVVIFDVAARRPQRILAVPGNEKLRSLRWNDNETLLIILSATAESKVAAQTSREYFRIIAQDVHGGDGRMLPMDPAAVARREKQSAPLVNLVRIRLSKPHTVLASTPGNGMKSSLLLEIDTVTGKSTVIKYGSAFTTYWVADRDGHAVAREDWDWHKRAFRVYALEPGDHIKEIMRTDDSEQPRLEGLAPDGLGLVVLAMNGRARQAAWELPLDGSAMRLLADDPDADVTGTSTDPNTDAIVGAYFGGEGAGFKWLEAQAQHRADSVAKAFPGKHVEIRNWTADATKVLAEVSTPSSPPVDYWVDFTTHRADIAGEEYPSLANVALGDAQRIDYKARDGTTIPAILTTPPGKNPVPVPLIVLPHGGPYAHDYFRFDWLAQFLATRGFAVLQPQFRGSTGYGKAFEEAGYRQWGGLMQDDVTDGVAAMIDRGIADSHRVCIVGASYGGYAALAGASFTPSLYRCAVSINGVADLPALMRSEVPLYGSISSAESFWKVRIGEPHEARLDAVSPINSVNRIVIPVLIVYGTGDGVVPNEQSERVVRALRTAGKSVEVEILQGEDHWLSGSKTRIQVLRRLDAFLKANL
jgi:dipeptidyl aminopeptidase/acylaminoacyl peptidase